jgi:hypothetical protein
MEKSKRLKAKILDRVMDALDVETVLVSDSENEARNLAKELMLSLGLKESDIVLLEHKGKTARLRIRSYVHRPGCRYAWLRTEKKRKGVD